MKLKTFFSKRVFFSIVVVSFVFTEVFNGIRSCCASNSYDKFEEAMEEGNLSEAKTILKEGNIDNDAALQLIKAYLDTGNSDAAVDVYENITSNHTSRYEMQFTNLNNGEYEQKACKMFREYFMQHGQYQEAWNYYPLDYDDENYHGNAKCRFAWVSDAVSEMCKKGRQDDARNFIDDQLRWFVTNIDGETDDGIKELKVNYGSEVVRQKLYNQIDNVH